MESPADYPLTTKKQIHAIVQSHAILTDRSKSHRTSSRLSMLFVLLGVCVFVWGLGYKLSLYEAQTSSIHRIPEAKLLCRNNEDPNATETLRVCLSDGLAYQECLVISAALIVFWCICDRRLASNWAIRMLDMPKVRHSRLRLILSTFFFRPPPAYPGL